MFVCVIERNVIFIATNRFTPVGAKRGGGNFYPSVSIFHTIRFITLRVCVLLYSAKAIEILPDAVSIVFRF